MNRIVVRSYTLFKVYSLLTFQHVQPEKQDKKRFKNMRAYTMTRNIRFRLKDFLKQISKGKST